MTTPASTTAERAELLRSLHVPGDPLIVTNVWDAATARAVAAVPGVRALATASASVSASRGVDDGEGLTVEQALDAARTITGAVDLPVSVDFERGYSADAAGVEANVQRLAEAG
ncbi:MAG: isocitrate lyase/phosphoenolpyruvate mutase family protein, partial [Pseudolysinimonas sp.]